MPISSAGKPIPKDLFDCPADINGDSIVDINDYLTFLSDYQSTCNGCPGDLNGDGTVDINDFNEFNTAYGEPCFLQSALMSVCPLGAQYRYGRNNYPTSVVDPPVPNGSNLALGGVTIKTNFGVTPYQTGSVQLSDSLRIDINGGDGSTVYHGGYSLPGKTIRQVNGQVPAEHYGYWRVSGRDNVCSGTEGIDFDYNIAFSGANLKVTYTLFYSIPEYPPVMTGTGWLYGLHENPIDGSCITNHVMMPYPLSLAGTFSGPSYLIYY